MYICIVLIVLCVYASNNYLSYKSPSGLNTFMTTIQQILGIPCTPEYTATTPQTNNSRLSTVSTAERPSSW